MKAAWLLLLLAEPAVALTPGVPCRGVESNMAVTDAVPLDPEGRSGVVIEAYSVAYVSDPYPGAFLPAPVPELVGFEGARVMLCTTGEFVAFSYENDDAVMPDLNASWFLRDALGAGAVPRFADIRRAAERLYSPVVVLRETEETCGCATYFPELRPAGHTPFAERADQQDATP